MKSEMEQRVQVTVKNTSRTDVRCVDILGANISGIFLNEVIHRESVVFFTTDQNNRFFLKFESFDSGATYPMGMTCPYWSSNSATGYGTSGLQVYETNGTPAKFEFHLGSADLADWDNGDAYHGISVPYGEV